MRPTDRPRAPLANPTQIHAATIKADSATRSPTDAASNDAPAPTAIVQARCARGP